MKAKRNQQGFSLLEVLVAFAILALSVGILLKIFSGGVNTAVLAEEYTSAVEIAESLMASVGVESVLQVGESSGTDDDKYHWLVAVTPYQFNPNELDPDFLKSELLKVDVWVGWGEEGREVHLSTLKFVTKSINESEASTDGG